MCVLVAELPASTVNVPPFSSTTLFAMPSEIENAPLTFEPLTVAEVPAVSAAPLDCVTPVAAPPADTVIAPPESTVVLVAVPPDDTVCRPPLLTFALVATPPASTLCVPPPRILAEVSVPCTFSVPPADSVVDVAEPPADTASMPPLTIAPAAEPPLLTLAEPPLPMVVALATPAPPHDQLAARADGARRIGAREIFDAACTKHDTCRVAACGDAQRTAAHVRAHREPATAYEALPTTEHARRARRAARADGLRPSVAERGRDVRAGDRVDTARQHVRTRRAAAGGHGDFAAGANRRAARDATR